MKGKKWGRNIPPVLLGPQAKETGWLLEVDCYAQVTASLAKQTEFCQQPAWTWRGLSPIVSSEECSPAYTMILACDILYKEAVKLDCMWT